MGFNLADYEPVADRIERFWNDYAEGRITTDLVQRDDKSFIVKALIWRNAASDNEWSGPDATGYAEEIVGSTNVNKTSALENCETSAIGRALANLGYAPKGQRPSREEMVKVASRGETEQIIDEARNQTDRDKTCPDCGAKVYDNRDTNRKRVLDGKKPMPAFKCSDRTCTGNKGEPWVAWEANYFDDFDDLIVERGTGEIVEPPVARDDYGPDEAPF